MSYRPTFDGKPRVAERRRDYLIDGFRVSYLHQDDWQCACREFALGGACRHTREAVGMRDAQARIQRRLQSGVSDFLPLATERRSVVPMRARA